MSDILRGPKTHDLIHHLVEDLLRHGNPSGFDVSVKHFKDFSVVELLFEQIPTTDKNLY